MNRAEAGLAGFDELSCDDGGRGKIERNLHGAMGWAAGGNSAIAILSAIRDKKFTHGRSPDNRNGPLRRQAI
jgi:hypothetical protein